MCATYEDHDTFRENPVKRSPLQRNQRERPHKLFKVEKAVGVGARSQRMARVIHHRPYPVNGSASDDSCIMMGNISNADRDAVVDAYNSGALVSNSKASCMCNTGRMRMRKQLVEELDKVRNLISILETRESDIRSFLQMPELNFNISSSKSACEPAGFALAEERVVESVRRKAKGAKRRLCLKGDLQLPKRQKFDKDAKKLAELMRQCGTILKRLCTHRFSWVFSKPVDYVGMKIPDYPLIIKHPMDLGTIKTKLESHEYGSPLEFAADVRLTFANAMKYNPKGHDVHYMADILLKIFEERWKTLEKKLKQLNLYPDSQVSDGNEPGATLVQSSCDMLHGGFSSTTTASRDPNEWNGNRRQMTQEEKQVLSRLLEEAPLEKAKQVMAIIDRKDPGVQVVDGEVTLEIDSLDWETLWELYDLLKPPNMASKSLCQDATQNTLRENDVDDDEEIDIGVEAPTTSYAPVDIDRDAVGGSSPSSESSGYSSASSDSDSGNTSGNDSDADDAQSRGLESVPSPGKEPVGLGAICEPSGSPTPKVVTDDAKRPLMDLDEHVSIARPGASDAELVLRGQDRVQDQEKLHRAALLKRRFADTILKAKEKTLPFGKTSVDREKLRKEKEELERLQREEKARLQAEARAAEAAQRKVEAGACEKLRRQREAERKAARLELQQMEKNAEREGRIDFLKDFEMLGSAPVQQHLHNFSPCHSQGDLVSFPIRSGNPLEQLGLFMKEDEDEDDR